MRAAPSKSLVSAKCSIATRSRFVDGCIWLSSCCLHVVPSSSKPDHIASDLIITRYVSQGGGESILVLPAADPKGPRETCDSTTCSLARPCLRCCSTLWVFGGALSSSTLCANFKADFFFSSRSAQHRDVATPAHLFFFVFERQHHRTVVSVENVFFPP